MQIRRNYCSSDSMRSFSRSYKRYPDIGEWRPVPSDSGLHRLQAYRERPYVGLESTHQRGRMALGPHRYDEASGLPQIEEAIENGRSILLLPRNWDDDGAKQIKSETFSMAAALLRKAAEALYRSSRLILPAPRINPCADGSVDLYWKTIAFTLLINVKEGGILQPDFYGERAENRQDIRGPLSLDEPDFDFLNWLVK